MMRKKKRSSTTVDKDSTLDIPKSKKTKSSGRPTKSSVQNSHPDSVFGQFLKESGVTLTPGNTANEIAVDQVIFQKRLQQRLRKNPRFPNEFISGLETYFEEPERFRNCLLPCVPESAGEENTNSGSYQESLVRLLLGIEMLQTLVINILFEKLPEFMFEGVCEDGLNVPRLIINQLKWLDRIIDGKDLSSKLMQMVSVAPVEIQRDIITSLPEILEDSQHGDMARELNGLLQQNTQLTVPILDALSSLNLSSALLSEVREAVMGTLSAVQLEDLPVVVKFILHSISASDVNEVVCDLRKKLELEQCVLPAVLQASQSRMHSKKAARSSSVPSSSNGQDSVTLILEVIKSAIRFQKTITEAWLKAIENVDESEDHKVVDLLVLFILHSTNANHSRRGAERVFKIKVRKGLIQETLLQKAFKGHAQVMRGYFSSILALAQGLLRSPDCCVVPFGGHMYKQAFTAFDSYCQQEVVGSLVTHACSGVSGEVDVALELLCELVSQRPTEMSQFVAFLKGILDYMDNLSSQQIRRLFHLLSRLAFGQEQQGGHIQDDMHIVIRKQLSSTVPKYKRIGIIGAVMMVGSMGACRNKPDGSQGGTLPKETHRQVMALLELVRSCSESSPEAAALCYDELANLMQTCKLDPLVQAWIGKSVLEDFQEDFVVDLGPQISGLFVFPASVMYNLDEEESQGGIAINLLPLMAQDQQHKTDTPQPAGVKRERHVSPLCLSPFFRLLRLSEEAQHQGDLEEIDALLGCPLVLTDMEVVQKVESLSKTEREFLCSLLFHTINWFREVVNAFCRQKDPEMKMKVVTRIQNITSLQSLLQMCLTATPGYIPPQANFDGESAEGMMPSSSIAPPKKAKKESTGKKRKASASKNSSADKSELEGATEAEESQQDHPEKESEKEKEKDAKSGVSLSSYWPFFRELDVEALSVLQCGLLSRTLLDTELHSKVREEVQLGPAELHFLLEDMWRKMDFSLASAPAKKAPFLKSKTDRAVGFAHLQQKNAKEIATCCIELLPTLCTHLENCHNHFQTVLSENQGVVDAPGVDVKEQQLMCSAYQLLLQVLHTTFSWAGFSGPEHRALLKNALGVLASRLKEEETDLTLDQLSRHAFQYLQNFRSTVPSLSTALCLTQLLIVLSQYGGSNHRTYREQISSLARHFLCQEWVTVSGEKERGNKYNDTLQTLLSIYLEHTDDVLKAVEEITSEGIPELLNAAKDASSRSWPTLNRQTFLVYYKSMMAELERAVRKIPPSKQADNREVQSEKLLTWNLAVRDFHILINLVKVFDSRPVFTVCLKYGRLFLESFLKLGMPLLDYSFKKHKEDVQSLLKTFQLSTRQLHHMCGHSKIRQDTGLTNHVPALKKNLEQFVYRVKAMLALNHCQEAFWLGNLKNRDLKGEEILSQRSQAADEEEEESSQLQSEVEQESDSDERNNGHQEEEVEESDESE
ncbi:Fanconi anemia group D2 protein isoform X1 [Myxocyprinus asiaticus]|uniref:Fanconi anemia group D2 protein isoform X1 n=1 Tax=Myxocyprinus asiaticus TaxID=70543 RepID=UPI002223EB29|nr:Fanconi anemia group D2 protein isoform X1 [Myxocyprinus asiaticus]